MKLPKLVATATGRSLTYASRQRLPVLLVNRFASTSAPPTADWTKQSWATLSHIPERIEIEGTDPSARVNADHSNVSVNLRNLLLM